MVFMCVDVFLNVYMYTTPVSCPWRQKKKKKGIGSPKSRVTHSGELPYMCGGLNPVSLEEHPVVLITETTL